MTNEERILRWRAARQKDTGTTPHGTTDPGGAMEAFVGVSLARPEDVLATLVAVLRRMPRETIPQRREVYNAFESGQSRAIDRAVLPAETADAHRRQLRSLVRSVETDLRAGIDIFADGYAPAGMADAHARLDAGHARRLRQRRIEDARQARRLASRRDEALDVELTPDEAADLMVLRQRLSRMYDAAWTPVPGERQSRARTIGPLIVLQLQVIHAESRIALIWALVAPAVLLTLISSLYFLAGSQYVLDMDVPTFSMLGATTWIMFRQIIFRSSTSYVSSRALINLEAVTPLTLVLVQSFIYLLIYTVVYAILVSAGYEVGLITLPSNWIGFAFYVAMMGVAGGSIGLIFGGIATIWPFFLRFAAVIERSLELFSGVFFVSEQLPEQYRPYFLWSPLAHGMQLLRSSYFAGYKSQDASPGYFLTSIVFLAAAGFLIDWRVRSNVQPM